MALDKPSKHFIRPAGFSQTQPNTQSLMTNELRITNGDALSLGKICASVAAGPLMQETLRRNPLMPNA